MSRPSAKQEVVKAALRLAADTGLAALTFEAVAETAGKTKGGVIYHFRSKDDLVRAVVQQLIDEWDADASRHLGVPFDDATREDRIIAFLLSCVDPGYEITAAGDLSVLVDVMRDDRYVGIWTSLREKWIGDVSTLTITQQIALAAADGIWVDEAMQQAPYPDGRRETIVAELSRMVRGN
ncbi:TetR/AcrR family transcriptional regulator [Microbacterium amylolyticum]|uniref:AcrR family transcriptional regulator n=1 Tax=Microbacterium amylolyticum TaxID=936337 RepID=A0ABS4ZIA2_9MICO|nr:TetR/AcrR family transcriptional regulator [Microbacterium amylolyticum]MBP2437009.1 AcrR family transcriptional regulator [Microbacterium amylolyticum]